MFKVTSLITAVFLAPSSAHFMWQHEGVRGEDAVVALTFAEAGGIDHAESEAFAQRLQDNGVVASVLNSETSAKIDLEIDGKFVVGTVPKRFGNDYATEGYVKWGVYAGHGSHTIPPMLVFEHTIASHMSRKNRDLSYRNTFRLEMNGTFRNKDKCSEEEESLCIEAKVVWQDEAVSDADIMVNHGEGEASTITTDADGRAYFSVPWADKRLYGRVNYKVDESGDTKNGEHYDSISHWATASYEFSKTRMDLDSWEEKPFYPEGRYHHDHPLHTPHAEGGHSNWAGVKEWKKTKDWKNGKVWGENQDGEEVHDWENKHWEEVKAWRENNHKDWKGFGAEHESHGDHGWDHHNHEFWMKEGNSDEHEHGHGYHHSHGYHHDHGLHNGHGYHHGRDSFYHSRDESTHDAPTFTMDCRGLALVALVSFMGSFLGFALLQVISKMMKSNGNGKVYTATSQVDPDCEKQQHELVSAAVID